MPDDVLIVTVMDELSWDPKVDPEEFAVSADHDGRVTLRGTVASFREKSEAERGEGVFVAGNILGAFGVDNEILLTESPCSGDVAHDIQKTLSSAPSSTRSKLTVARANVTVTLRRTVRSWVRTQRRCGQCRASPASAMSRICSRSSTDRATQEGACTDMRNGAGSPLNARSPRRLSCC